MLFNINDEIKVKPTELGNRVWKDYHQAYSVDRPLRVDEHGWVKLQLWEVMRVFGPHMGNGRDNVIETTISLPEKNHA